MPKGSQNLLEQIQNDIGALESDQNGLKGAIQGLQEEKKLIEQKSNKSFLALNEAKNK